jgi:MYXO-CTERM domain-containing protein
VHTQRQRGRLLTTLAALFLAAASARADVIVHGDSNNHLGTFQGTITYTAVDSTHGTLTVTLTNTTVAGNGGYITGVAFNNPNNQITGVTLSSSNSNFQVTGGSTYQNTIATGAFGKFDIGATTGTNWDGGGSASKGTGQGQTVTFTFNLTGTNMDKLTTQDFVDTTSSGGQFLAVRFRGIQFKNGGTQGDKVAAVDAPEPGTLTLAALGLLALTGWCRRRRALV